MKAAIFGTTAYNGKDFWVVRTLRAESDAPIGSTVIQVEQLFDVVVICRENFTPEQLAKLYWYANEHGEPKELLDHIERELSPGLKLPERHVCQR